ncbi:hypothetical protein K443DRAFT_685437 [Laccaria amethystina LaAM-08-1]|uniref:Uncharacterized protein n=1 Tax=Laccaria amethystina LaAM-08-1 TaxID=1095629 RepID=A0A0C9X3A1_9AGAR|nr:hypothetical protein K443DRAFT_685437 [Laccaria amethystina LaAM-08-1]
MSRRPEMLAVIWAMDVGSFACLPLASLEHLKTSISSIYPPTASFSSSPPPMYPNSNLDEVNCQAKANFQANESGLSGLARDIVLNATAPN